LTIVARHGKLVRVHDYLGTRAERVGICASPSPQQMPFGVATAHIVLEPYVTAVSSSGAVPPVLPCIDGHHGGAVRHRVDIVAGSQLASAVGTLRLDTGSLHDQAVDRLGAGLRVTARAEDGIVEALEMPRLLAVQWHPELELGQAGAPLFDWLASCARASLCG
jgi:gamma-glutamyl-gamma-aminobutyrate hydrolase PuuD